MNICIISQRYPYKDNMEFVFVKKIVDEWARMGHHCVVITDYSLTTRIRKRIKYKPRHYSYEVTSTDKVDIYNPRYFTTGLIIRSVSIDAWVSSFVLERCLARLPIKFDLIYCHFFSSSLKVFRYAKKWDIPLFVATGESEIGSLAYPYPGFDWDDFRRYTKGVIAVSTKNKNEAIDNGYIMEEKCRVFPNGTDVNVFHCIDRAKCRTQLGLPQDAFIISCVGFFCERKGQNRLLEAVRLLKDKSVGIIFIGKEAKGESIFLSGEEVLFKGAVENNILPYYLCASDVFCLPTLAEGCCNAIIEALACGLPVISSNLSFNWDVLNARNSVLVDPNDIQAIASAINKLKGSLDRRNSLSKGALNTAVNLSIAKRAQSILDFIKYKM